MLTDRGQCKIGDFGVSAQLNNTLQQRQTTCGTPLFMAPEVITGGNYTALADVWSLGILAIQVGRSGGRRRRKEVKTEERRDGGREGGRARHPGR